MTEDRVTGFSFTSDESPPEGNRYQGLRFQISHAYVVFFRDRSSWDDPEFANTPPCVARRYMTDIVNCPGKSGPVVLDVLSKQLSRLNLFLGECVAGVGDGGGENEGTSGIHSLMEDRRPDYVRRRCFGHLPWRVAGAGLNEMDSFNELFRGIKAISEYLHEGVTWNRLKSIAVLPPAEGGLALFADGSPEYAFYFTTSPPRNMTERPETTAELLKWLQPRESVLRRVVTQDHETRNLSGQSNILARATIADRKACVFRRIAYVLLKKALYLFYYIEAKKRISVHDDLTTLIDEAAHNITSVSIDDRVLEHIGTTAADLAVAGVHHDVLSWVEVAVLMTDGVTNEYADEIMAECLQFHQRVSMRMHTHLVLTAANIDRSTWLSARFLLLLLPTMFI